MDLLLSFVVFWSKWSLYEDFCPWKGFIGEIQVYWAKCGDDLMWGCLWMIFLFKEFLYLKQAGLKGGVDPVLRTWNPLR